MRMIHGSVQDVLASEHGKFDVFDYKINNDGKPDNKYIDNGNDAKGPGIYAWPGHDENYAQGLKSAACYTGKDSGYIYVLDVDVEEDDLLNNLEPDFLSNEEWVTVIEEYIRLTHEEEGISLDKFNELVWDIESKIDEGEELPSFEEIESIFDEFGMSLDCDSENPNEFEDGYEWAENIRAAFDLADPCSKIHDNGGPNAIAEHAVNRSDDFWESLVHVWSSIATDQTGLGINTYNKRFLNAVKNTVGKEYDLNAARVNDGDFYVIFNPEAIRIEKIIDVSPSKETEYSEGVSL